MRPARVKKCRGRVGPVRSDAATVDAYLAEVPTERRGGLELLRGLCRDGLPGYDEAMRYGMPPYLRGGVVEVAFASRKRHVSLYVLREGALRAAADRLGSLPVGKGCVRFTSPGRIDPELVRALLAATVADAGEVC